MKEIKNKVSFYRTHWKSPRIPDELIGKKQMSCRESLYESLTAVKDANHGKYYLDLCKLQ